MWLGKMEKCNWKQHDYVYGLFRRQCPFRSNNHDEQRNVTGHVWYVTQKYQVIL